MNVCVTAGPTREIIDPVRFISNNSTGKMGYAIAKEAMLRGADVTLISGKVNIAPVPFVKLVDVISAKDMYDEVIKAAEDFNIDLEKSWMIGDGENDVLAGKNAGCKTVLIGSQDYKQDYTVSSLKEFVDKML